ncbi:MAG: hypothetical protein ABWW65_00610 [Thermoprotei archaeon]
MYRKLGNTGIKISSIGLGYAKALTLNLEESDIRELNRATEKYVSMWGNEYILFNTVRYVPGIIQSIYLALLGGI